MEELLKKHKQEKKELQGKLEIDEREREIIHLCRRTKSNW